jgi:putative FmdB family regulatory protein
MPTYEYQCDNCGYNFETKQSFKDEALTLCPNCGQNLLHRVPQAAGVVFKGSGWYITDSKGKQNLAASGEKKVEGTAAEAAPAATSDTSSAANGSGEKSATPAAKETPAATTSSKTESPAAT